MKRERTWTLFFFLGFIAFSVACFFPQSSYASPAEDVLIRYNLKTQVLLVTIKHDTMFKGSHYIKFVEIKKNGNVVSINTYDSQPSGDSFTNSYRVPAIEDDIIEVTVTCSRGDKKISHPLTVK